MHLPWTQVANEAVEAGESLGRLFGVGPDAGVGLMVKLHRWALRRAPDGDFSGQLHDAAPAELVAAGLGIEPKRADTFWAALKRCGFVEGDGETARIRGLRRYESAWKRNRPRAESARSPRGGPTAAAQPDADADADADVPPLRGGTPVRAAPAVRNQRQHRLPIIDLSDESEPKHQDAVNALVAGFASAGMGKYLWQGAKDGKALSELLKVATLEDVLTRWRRGLGAPAEAWASCRTVAQLKQKWNDLAPPAGPPPAPKLDEATAEAVDRVLKGYPDHLSAYVARQISQHLRWRRDGDELIGETEDKYFADWCLEHYPTLAELGMRVALVGGGAAA